MTILTRAISDTPVAVIDLETTGLSPQGDRIVEMAVVRIDPGQAPRLVLDTLVNPQRRVSGSEIHGIYDADVVGAPTFADLVRPVADAIDGAVVASFNVYFDIKFLLNELELAQQPVALPHLCLMWMRPGLGLGARASLERTCAELGVPFSAVHQAAADAEAGAKLWPIYTNAFAARGVRTFADLAAVKGYKYTQSWSSAPLDRALISAAAPRTGLKVRTGRTQDEQYAVRRAEWNAQDALAAYWDALTGALVDNEITAAERAELRRLQASPHLRPESIRYVHAKVMSGVLDEVSRDLQVDGPEVEWVGSVARLLRELGWSPGDLPVPARAASPVSEAPALSASSAPQRAPALSAPAPARTWWQRLFE